MQIFGLLRLQISVFNELSTIELAEKDGYFVAKLSAIKNCLDEAKTLGNNTSSSEQDITDLMQFCNDKIDLWKIPDTQMAMGFRDGYQIVKNYLMGENT